MKMYLRLVSALIQGVEPSDKEKKRNKAFYVVMTIIAGFGIMLPMTFFVGVIIYALTGSLKALELGTTQNGVELFLHLISAFSFIFGLNVIFSVFYFSGDIENLLPLPLRPYQIIASKFTAALISESVMEVLVIIAALAGYIIGGGLHFYSWIIALIGTLTVPILPLVYCGILCMVVMYFTRFVKNNLSTDSDSGGFLLFPNTYKDIRQIDVKPYTVDADQMEMIQKNVCNYFGVNQAVLENSAKAEELEAFYDGAVEPFAIQFSEAMTKAAFSERERAQGSGIRAASNRLQYMSTTAKVQMAKELGDRGAILIDEIRELFNYDPLPDGAGQVAPIRGEYKATETLTDGGANNADEE